MESAVRSMARMLGSLALLGSFSLITPASAAPPPEAYARLPQFRHIALSPSGKRLAWEEDGKEVRKVTVLDIDSGKTLASIPLGDSLRDLHWSDETALLLKVAAARSIEVDNLEHRLYEYRRLLRYDLETKQSCVLLMDGGDRYHVTGAALLASRVTNAHTLSMASWDWSLSAPRVTESRLADRRRVWVYNAFSVDTRTCRGTLLYEGAPQTIDWVVDAAGQPVARADWDVERHKYRVLAKDGTSWRTVFTQDDTMELGGLSSDGKSVLAMGPAEDGRSKLWSIPLQGDGAKPLIDDASAAVTGFIFNDFTNTLLGVELGYGRPEVRWLDDRARQRDEALKKTFKASKVRTVSHSQDFSRVVAEVESATAAPTVYLVDFSSGKADVIGEPYPELAKTPAATTQRISYATQDGKPLLADLTLPDGQQKNLPTIVLSHDGPEDRDYRQFDWLVQFLVSRGYAVLQPQFRGSTSAEMRNDLAEGARVLISRGIADQRRICVAGTGYGAYAALAGASLGPVGLYSCAIGINGIYHLSDYLAYIEEHHGEKSLTAQYWREYIGKPADAQAGDSAVTNAARRTPIPVLLVHAEADTVTPPAQAEQLYRSMAGRPVQLVKLPHEDHYLSNAASRLALLKELETFLARTLAPASP